MALELGRKSFGHGLVAAVHIKQLDTVGLNVNGQFLQFLHLLAGPVVRNDEVVEQHHLLILLEGFMKEDVKLILSQGSIYPLDDGALIVVADIFNAVPGTETEAFSQNAAIEQHSHIDTGAPS